MTHQPDPIEGLTPEAAAAHVMRMDISEMLDRAEVVYERRPAKMVTALRIDLDIQAELEKAAAARRIGVSTLMRQIIEEWVQANRGKSAPDQMSELVRHLDAARLAASSLAQPSH